MKSFFNSSEMYIILYNINQIVSFSKTPLSKRYDSCQFVTKDNADICSNVADGDTISISVLSAWLIVSNSMDLFMELPS